jgi:diadenosine tetraphosphatase ApaH/serine/threonine PP2A family protein phosphatase
VQDSILCFHGGSSPDVAFLDQIRLIDRYQEVPTESAFCDLLRSDPDDDADPWGASPRGAGWLFGRQYSTA